MKGGAENRRKTITAGALGAAALICIVVLYNELFGGATTPAPTPAVTKTAPAAATAKGEVSSSAAKPNGPGAAGPGVAVPGVAAVKLASTSSSLDPTLDESAMLRTESLVYSGSGRNIFSATYTPPPVAIVKPIAKVRPGPVVPSPPPGPQLPPPPPPINLKFFGTAKRGASGLQAFFLSGEDVYLAAQGDIVARKYKIGEIKDSIVQVTDLQNNNTQTLYKQMN